MKLANFILISQVEVKHQEMLNQLLRILASSGAIANTNFMKNSHISITIKQCFVNRVVYLQQ
ncbi:hypothetical protein H1Q63_02070 [Desmonostoc muscorum CCALA 125]|nr:hypothetical protein [Desmonostoc muscorum CCALA 125]